LINADDMPQRVRLCGVPRDAVRYIFRNKTGHRPAVPQYEGNLSRMEFGVDRDCHEARMPDREQDLEIGGPIAHDQCNPVGGLQLQPLAQGSREAHSPVLELLVSMSLSISNSDCGTLAEGAGGIQ
jgi:hypothetical protein